MRFNLTWVRLIPSVNDNVLRQVLVTPLSSMDIDKTSNDEATLKQLVKGRQHF